MFLRTIRTSLSSSSRLMLIWTLLVRTNQRSSANLRKRRRKTLLLNSTQQHLCSHHLLCCQMLLLKLSLRWLTRLLMLNLSLLHELSTKLIMLALVVFLAAIVSSFSIPVRHNYLDPNGPNGFRDGLLLQCRHSLVWFDFNELAIPLACMRYMQLLQPDLGTLFKPEVRVTHFDAAVQRHRIVVDKLERAADADWLHVAYTRLSGFHEEITRLGGDSFAARDALEKKYHPSTTGSTKSRG
uniref:ORF7 protein n=1 Tax=Bat Coronavirus MsYN20 TaxID=3018866 RepID=A0AA49EC49_9NIDO|nr:ORF7 protein [Bat Coronavirus MsYN20]